MTDVILQNDNFMLVMYEGTGMYDTPYACLEVRSRGKADEQAVRIEMHANMPKFDGTPVQYKYHSDAYVSYGLNNRIPSRKDIEDLIEVLQDAINFADRVNAWLNDNTEWLAS